MTSCSVVLILSHDESEVTVPGDTWPDQSIAFHSVAQQLSVIERLSAYYLHTAASMWGLHVQHLP